MHPLKIASIVIFILGIVLLVWGLVIYRTQSPTADATFKWASFLILMGILILLGAIVMLCFSLEYDRPQLQSLPEVSSEV